MDARWLMENNQPLFYQSGTLKSEVAEEILLSLRRKLLSYFSVLSLSGIYFGRHIAEAKYPFIHFTLYHREQNELMVMLSITLKSISNYNTNTSSIIFVTRYSEINGNSLADEQSFEFQCSRMDNTKLDEYIKQFEPFLKIFLSRAPIVRDVVESQKKYGLSYEPSFPIQWKKLILLLKEYNLDKELENQSKLSTKAILPGKTWESLAFPVRKAIRKYLDSLGTVKILKPSITIEIAIMRCMRRTINKLLAPILDLYRNQNATIRDAMTRVAAQNKQIVVTETQQPCRLWHADDAKEAVPESFHTFFCSKGQYNRSSPFFSYVNCPLPPNSLIILRAQALCETNEMEPDVLDCPWIRWPLGAKSIVFSFLPKVAKWAGLHALIAARNFGIVLPALKGHENTIDSIATQKLQSLEQEIQRVVELYTSFL